MWVRFVRIMIVIRGFLFWGLEFGFFLSMRCFMILLLILILRMMSVKVFRVWWRFIRIVCLGFSFMVLLMWCLLFLRWYVWWWLRRVLGKFFNIIFC